VLQEKEKLLEEKEKGKNLTMQKWREPTWLILEQALITWINQA
jgi:hypothetical protein